MQCIIEIAIQLYLVSQFKHYFQNTFIGECVTCLLPHSGWRCEVCDLQENIWMNLVDGKLLCGRRYFDGSGGNNHALLHFRETGYPIAVKLGTITPDGAGKQVAGTIILLLKC